MPSYKLTYFSVEARGELIRLIFAQAGVKYEDVRISFSDFGPIKDSTPFGSLPVLEIDSSEVLSGSAVIGRYLAEKFGLAGKNEFENAKIASIKDFQDEVVLAMLQAFFEKDSSKKEERVTDLKEKRIPKTFQELEKVVKRNPAGSKWLYGPEVTYVDLNLYLVINGMKLFEKNPAFLDEYPAVKIIYEAVGELPNVAQYIIFVVVVVVCFNDLCLK